MIGWPARQMASVTSELTYPARGWVDTESSEVRPIPHGLLVAQSESNVSDCPGEWLSGPEDAMLVPSTGTERVFSGGFSPRWADILGDIRYLLVRASGGHRSCLGYDGRRGEVNG